MKNYIQIFLKSIILISFLLLTSCDQKNEKEKKTSSESLENDQKVLSLDSIKRISVGEESAKITIIAYESLTCGHCADFHKNVYPSLKKDFIEKGLVRIEFRHCSS
jgi:protein-disulfide isomerase